MLKLIKTMWKCTACGLQNNLNRYECQACFLCNPLSKSKDRFGLLTTREYQFAGIIMYQSLIIVN